MSDPFDLDLDRALELVPRYAIDGPRYTSYPTAPVWKEDYGPADFRADLGAAAGSAGLSLYVHVPYCESLCHFCACNKVITRDRSRARPYLDTIAREVEAVREALGAERPVTQLHWGGGTPTWLDPDEVGQLFRSLADAFPLAPEAEVSIEVDPRVTTDAHLEALVACGFNRISMGVQDFDPRVQEAIRRIQPADLTAPCSSAARTSGRSAWFSSSVGSAAESARTIPSEAITVSRDPVASPSARMCSCSFPGGPSSSSAA